MHRQRPIKNSFYETIHIVNDIGEQYSLLPKLKLWSLLIPKTIEVPINMYLYWVEVLLDINCFPVKVRSQGHDFVQIRCCVVEKDN